MVRGENSVVSKINNEIVYSVRKLYDEGVKPIEIAKMFNLSRIHVMRLGKRQSWKHLPEI